MYCARCKCVVSAVGVVPESVEEAGLKLLAASRELVDMSVVLSDSALLSKAQYEVLGERLGEALENITRGWLTSKELEGAEAGMYVQCCVQVGQCWSKVATDWRGRLEREDVLFDSTVGGKVDAVLSSLFGLESWAEGEERV